MQMVLMWTILAFIITTLVVLSIGIRVTMRGRSAASRLHELAANTLRPRNQSALKALAET
jgi:hypothetical protein